MRPLSIFIPILILLSACEEDIFSSSIDDQQTNQLVDYRLQSYFDAFEYEAAIRGYNIDLAALEITGVIEDIQENGVAGTCQYGRHIAHVTVDRNYWNRSTVNNREMVVFHELGHCVLNRGHLEGEFNNGICQSIMNSGTSGCAVIYNANTKDYYLDELFSSAQSHTALVNTNF